MTLVRKDRLEVKLAGYAIGSAGAVEDPKLLTAAQDYKRYTASRMIPLEAGDVQKRFGSADYHVSLKIDGEFNLLVYDQGEIITINPGGTVRYGLPFLKDAADQLKSAGIKKALIPGELYYARPGDKRPRVHDVSRVARQPSSKAELDDLRFAPFDYLEMDGQKPTQVYRETWEKLNKIFAGADRLKLPESHWLKDGSEISKQFQHYMASNAEGIIVRSDQVGIFKVKPRHSIDAVVIGFTEGDEDRHGMIHDLLLGVMRADGLIHVLGHVGGGFSESDRRAFLSDLKDRIATSEYVEVNDQVAYHMVRPEIIIEISVLDMISHSTRGTPMNRMVLEWDSKAKNYKIVRRLPLVALISPQFIRRREDKSFNSSDIRLKQISDLVEIAQAERDARQLNTPTSKVLKREVYTKVVKNATMVRKLVMWQTNKQAEMDDFPAYVIHLTDFSANRKTPLERDIRVSNSADQIEVLWGELIEENITKGWNLVTTHATAIAPAKAATASANSEFLPDSPAIEEPTKKITKAKKTTKTKEVKEQMPVEPIPEESAVEEKPTPKKRASKKKAVEE